ncbi:hypothetical protein V8B55DRAFT_1331813 [Mucor lusitanicus]|uniref:Uncharacterized protein n=2 Tax=Mucor circinelloides f. lusitanicus TaxID=29924 RepID=A0A168QC29_MUCCL|nr:hypothetical protein FB192DRAFT_1444989 [Mucor lusitanicus]OAD09025.1 hypothetical protein MUCCIDRAFT_105998 [Mucor lusitanicus CBS 277.49]
MAKSGVTKKSTGSVKKIAPRSTAKQAKASSQSKKGKGKEKEANQEATKYINWNQKDQGTDGLTPMERIVRFLIIREGQYTNMYHGCKRDGTVVPGSKVGVINAAVAHFKDKGVAVKTSVIKQRLHLIFTEFYPKAYEMCMGTGGGAKGHSDKPGNQEFEDDLNEVCPRFREMKEIMGSRKTGNPFVVNSNRPSEEFNNALLEDSENEVERRQQLQHQDNSTDYGTTGDERQDSPASTSHAGDNGDGDDPSANPSIGNVNDISLTSAASSTKRKRVYSNVDEAIREEARQSNREFMAILTGERKKEVALSERASKAKRCQMKNEWPSLTSSKRSTFLIMTLNLQ